MTSKRLDITISTTGLLASHHSSTTYVDKSLHQHSRQRPVRETTVRPTVRLKELQSTVAESGVKFTREPFQDLWSLKAVWEAWLEKNHQDWKSMKDVGSYFWRDETKLEFRFGLSFRARSKAQTNRSHTFINIFLAVKRGGGSTALSGCFWSSEAQGFLSKLKGRGGLDITREPAWACLKLFWLENNVCHLSFRRIRWLSWGLNIFRKARFHDRSKK